MATLRQIVPPHAANDAAKVASLRALYAAEADVTPVVVLTRDDSPAFALCGSHRIAAMRDELDGEELDDVGAWVVQVDADELLEAVTASDSDRAEETVRTLESLLDGRGAGDFDRLVDALLSMGVLPDDAAAALEDQR